MLSGDFHQHGACYLKSQHHFEAYSRRIENENFLLCLQKKVGTTASFSQNLEEDPATEAGKGNRIGYFFDTWGQKWDHPWFPYFLMPVPGFNRPSRLIIPLRVLELGG